MSTFILIPGAGSDAWHWHLVVPELEARGHRAVAVDLPAADDSAGLADYANTVIAAGSGATGVVLVAQSMGGFTAPLAAGPLGAELIVLVNAMVPRPGERPGDWWDNTGSGAAYRAMAARDGRDAEAFDEVEVFLHDVPPELIEAGQDHVSEQSGTPFEQVWPLDAWPDVPTRAIVCRHDRMFPAEFQRRVLHDRLGIVPDEIDGGHVPALHSPGLLAELLDGYVKEL